jgi:ribosomal protein L32
MRYSEFKKELNSWEFKRYGKLLINLEDLEVYKGERNTKLVKDGRSYFDGGCWHMYPIALSDVHVYVVCPYCGEIHLHGNITGDYDGNRVQHCRGHHSDPNYNIEFDPAGTVITEKRLSVCRQLEERVKGDRV